MEDTLVILKPDGVNQKILSKVIKMFLNEGLIVSNLKAMELDRELLRKHYSHLIDKPFYPLLERYMLQGVVVIMIVSGQNAIQRVRDLVGATNPRDALPNTIRGLYGNKENMAENVIHASDSMENALLEIKRFYHKDNDLIDKSERIFQKKYEDRRLYEKY